MPQHTMSVLVSLNFCQIKKNTIFIALVKFGVNVFDPCISLLEDISKELLEGMSANMSEDMPVQMSEDVTG